MTWCSGRLMISATLAASNPIIDSSTHLAEVLAEVPVLAIPCALGAPGDAGDAGGSLGGALEVYHRFYKKPRKVNPKDSMKGSLLGPEFGDPCKSRSCWRRHAGACCAWRKRTQPAEHQVGLSHLQAQGRGRFERLGRTECAARTDA